MLSKKEFYTILYQPDNKILASSKNRPKVLENALGDIIKVFYRKKTFSSDHYNPYAKRFCRNANKLNTLGFLAPKINLLLYCNDAKAYLVYYEKMAGQTVFSLVKEGNEVILKKLMCFIISLHEKGVFFRSMHLENFLYSPKNNFILIDISDMKFFNKPLSVYMRLRNLKHIFLHHQDRHIWGHLGIRYWTNEYAQHANFSIIQKIQWKILKMLFRLP